VINHQLTNALIMMWSRPAGQQSGLLMRIAAAESVSLCRADEKLAAFRELERGFVFTY